MVHAEHDEAEVVLDVGDNGRCRVARGENRGRGTTLMHQCIDDVEITTGIGGTTVRFHRRLTADAA